MEQPTSFSVNVIDVTQVKEPEPYSRITKLLKNRKTQVRTIPMIAIEPKRVGLLCQEINNLFTVSSTDPTPVLTNYTCKITEVLPQAIYNKWVLEVFMLSLLIKKPLSR